MVETVELVDVVDKQTTQVRIEMDDDLYSTWKRAKADMRADTNDHMIELLLFEAGYIEQSPVNTTDEHNQ